MSTSKVERNRGQFRRGRSKTGGRRKGTPNKAAKEWKALALELTGDPELQDALRRRVLDRPDLLLRVAEHAYGKPRQSLDVYQQEMRMFVWPGHEDIAEE
jgi:hypothetical protein